MISIHLVSVKQFKSKYLCKQHKACNMFDVDTARSVLTTNSIENPPLPIEPFQVHPTNI